MKRILLAAVAAAFIFPGLAQAQDTSPSVRTFCRGSNIPAHKRLLRAAIKQKLTDSQISFNSVHVHFGRVRRSKGTLSPDFASGLQLSGGSTPSVTFTGSFPTPEPCEVTARMRIQVNYPAGKSITYTDVDIPATMLFFKPEGLD